MARYNDEKLLGQMVILVDVVSGETASTFEDPGEQYVTTRFRHAMLAPADGDEQADLMGRLMYEAEDVSSDIDPDGVVREAIRFIDDYEKGNL